MCELLRHAGPVVVERGERPGRSAELDRQAGASDLDDPSPGVEEGDEPAGSDEAEGGRHGLLQQCPGGHRRVAMLPRERHTSRQLLDVAQHLRDRLASDQHRGAVEHVLARRAEVDEALVLVADARAQRAHERLDGVPDRMALVDEILPAEGVRSKHASAIASEAAAGTTPAAAPAAASARSTSSIASSHDRPEVASRSSAGTNSASNAVTPRRMSCARPPGGRCRTEGPRPRRPRRACRAARDAGGRAPGPRRWPRPRRGSRGG